MLSGAGPHGVSFRGAILTTANLDHLPHQGGIVLVVGPSGAGKDAVITFARHRLHGNPHFAFARRLITRAAADPFEDHETCSEDAFEAAEAAGCLALSWRAHCTAYGIRNSQLREIDSGKIVIANVSRGVVASGIRLARRSMVVHVTASPHVLERRLQKRGRETATEIAGRLAREASQVDAGTPMLSINNDGPIEHAGTAFVDALLEFAGASQQRHPGHDPEPRP